MVNKNTKEVLSDWRGLIFFENLIGSKGCGVVSCIGSPRGLSLVVRLNWSQQLPVLPNTSFSQCFDWKAARICPPGLFICQNDNLQLYSSLHHSLIMLQYLLFDIRIMKTLYMPGSETHLWRFPFSLSDPFLDLTQSMPMTPA